MSLAGCYGKLEPGVRLIGRVDECVELHRLAGDVAAGRGRSLVLHGEPGAGKSALLNYLAASAAGCRVVQATGIESEMEVAFAGLYQACLPLLDGLKGLPGPQRGALQTIFGMSEGPVPDRFLIGLALRGLLVDQAVRQPLLCLVDDLQWLDRASAQAFAFAARSLGSEAVGMVFVTRAPGGDLANLPELPVRRLAPRAAAALLDAVLPGPIDGRVRDQFLVEARGNPLALLELWRDADTVRLAGGFGLPGALTPTAAANVVFRQRISELPKPAQILLLLAAADPTGDPALLRRAMAALGIDVREEVPVADAGLAVFENRVRFRHPLVRAATYRFATADDRRRAHGALAKATDLEIDPDRRAWHRAQAAEGADPAVADELAQAAVRASARGGLAAAAAFLVRASQLTVDDTTRVDRTLAAARVQVQAGELDAAQDLLAAVETGPLDDRQQADADLTRAQLAFVANRGGEAPGLLLKAASLLELVDPDLSRDAYLDALSAAIFSGRLAAPGGSVLDVARAAAAAPAPSVQRPNDLLLGALIVEYTQGYATSLPLLREALATFDEDMSPQIELRWLWLASVVAAARSWDYERFAAIADLYVRQARTTGAMSELPLALTAQAHARMLAGKLSAAAELIDEIRDVTHMTGAGFAPYASFALAAFCGDESAALPSIQATLLKAAQRGEGVGVTFAYWAQALLYNGHRRYDKALAAAQCACSYTADLGTLIWPLPELIESAVRTGAEAIATSAYVLLKEATGAADTDWSGGVLARSEALLYGGEKAELLYREAIDRLSRTRLLFDLARAHLLYGEWLRRRLRPREARGQLRSALQKFGEIGAKGFADRAQSELKVAGERAHAPTSSTGLEALTAQEFQIARLASEGKSNAAIGLTLHISRHTVQYHLRKVFAKLGISSRERLTEALAARVRGSDRLGRDH